MQYKDIHPKTILNRYKQIDPYFQCRYSMNIYRGCEHGCMYCDGRSSKYWPEGGNVTFSEIVLVKKTAPQLLDKELFKIKRKEPVCLGGGVNDAYQPCEKEFEVTRKCLEVLKMHKAPIHIITKSDMILRDKELVSEIAKQSWCHVSFSFSTPDAKIAKILEPGCTNPGDRLKAMKGLTDAGKGNSPLMISRAQTGSILNWTETSYFITGLHWTTMLRIKT